MCLMGSCRCPWTSRPADTALERGRLDGIAVIFVAVPTPRRSRSRLVVPGPPRFCFSAARSALAVVGAVLPSRWRSTSMPVINLYTACSRYCASEEEQHDEKHDRFARFVPIATVPTTLSWRSLRSPRPGRSACMTGLTPVPRSTARWRSTRRRSTGARPGRRSTASLIHAGTARRLEHIELFDQYGNSTPASKPSRHAGRRPAPSSSRRRRHRTTGPRTCAQSLQHHARGRTRPTARSRTETPDRFMQQTQWSLYRRRRRVMPPTSRPTRRRPSGFTTPRS